MNKDIRLSVEFFDHPKTVKLQRRLGLEAVISLQRLWLWSAQNRPNGQLVNMDAEDIEIAARWNGEFGKLYECLVELTWLDVGETICLHDWEDHNPWQAEAKARSESARRAAKARWGNANTSNSQNENDANAMHEQCGRNAGASNPQCPSPLPSSPEEFREDKSSPVGETSPTGIKQPFCPHDEIIAMYHEQLPELPRMRVRNSDRDTLLRTRWKESLQRLQAAGRQGTREEGLAWWHKYFALVRASPLLMGQVEQRGRDSPWMASFEWLIRPKNFAKVIEGQYLERKTA